MRGLTYVAAAALALGGVAFSGGCDRGDTTSGTSTSGTGTHSGSSSSSTVSTDNRTTGQKVGDAVGRGVDATTQAASNVGEGVKEGAHNLSEGVKGAATKATAALSPSGASDLTGIRGTVEGVVENAVSRNDFNTMAGYFTDADAQRLKSGKPDTKALDDAAEAFAKSWTSKYNDKFSVMDANTIYSDAFLKLSGGQSGATATIAASHGMPDLQVPVIEENGKWKIDLPDSVDANTVVTNLHKTLTSLNADTGAWPADKIEAYRLVTHKLMMAVLNKT